jgi:hypothetical protein
MYDINKSLVENLRVMRFDDKELIAALWTLGIKSDQLLAPPDFDLAVIFDDTPQVVTAIEKFYSGKLRLPAHDYSIQMAYVDHVEYELRRDLARNIK